MFGHTKHNHQTPHDAGSLNSINDHFQTVAIGPSYKSAGDFFVPESSVGEDSFGFVEISVDLVLTLHWILKSLLALMAYLLGS